MVVGRGNDAIPTWSGFNYQGKMMLLYVLELINQIAKDKNKDIDAYSVELEKTEDFCIICDSEYKSFHQVKAYLSKDKWNSYSKAMDKLLKHRVESNNPTAKCYLTVAKEIKDWDDASNTYNVSVPKAVMNDFDEMVKQKIDGIRKQKQNVEMLNDMFIRSIEEASFDVEVLSDMIYQKLLGE